MKAICLILLTSFTLCSPSPAQGLAGLFSQKTTELDYYAEQISAYGVYINDLEKGYETARKGLAAISAFKSGEFSLHQLFFGSLGIINPAIARDPGVTEILSAVTLILSTLKKLPGANMLTRSERDYLQNVCNHMSDECTKTVAELTDILRDGGYQMTDDERIRRITLLSRDTSDKLAFAQSFSNQLRALLQSRADETNDAASLKNLFK